MFYSFYILFISIIILSINTLKYQFFLNTNINLTEFLVFLYKLIVYTKIDHRVYTKRMDKCAAKKGYTKGPYSSKHARLVQKNIELSSKRNDKELATISKSPKN